MFDFNSLTGREVTMVEELSGVSITKLSDEEAPKGKFLSALYFVAKRREDSTFTFNQAWDTRLDVQNAYLGFSGEAADDAGEENASDVTATD